MQKCSTLNASASSHIIAASRWRVGNNSRQLGCEANSTTASPVSVSLCQKHHGSPSRYRNRSAASGHGIVHPSISPVIAPTSNAIQCTKCRSVTTNPSRVAVTPLLSRYPPGRDMRSCGVILVTPVVSANFQKTFYLLVFSKTAPRKGKNLNICVVEP